MRDIWLTEHITAVMAECKLSSPLKLSAKTFGSNAMSTTARSGGNTRNCREPKITRRATSGYLRTMNNGKSMQIGCAYIPVKQVDES